MPVDHLNEARCRLVARLIEARGLDGAAKDQSPHGDLEGLKSGDAKVRYEVLHSWLASNMQ